MTRPLRVFISSTVDDLVNERHAVAQRLRAFNCEPVNAEGWVPDGADAWTRIEREIKDSDIFVLLVGERYGFVPRTGSKADLGLSVTELEWQEAQRLRIPILPFFKELGARADHRSPEALQRERFKEQVGDWKNGSVRGTFRLHDDLADSVGRSVLALLFDEYARHKRKIPNARAGAPPSPARGAVELPDWLPDAVARGKALLFAGAGISMPAGLLSGAAFAQRLIQKVQEHFPDYGLNPVGAAFAGIATDLASLPDRETLLDAIVELTNPPYEIRPTRAHELAVKLFPRIVTTNYDRLFQDAAGAGGNPPRSITRELGADEQIPARAIVNLHGAAADRDSLVLTEHEILLLDRHRPRLWQELVAALREHQVVVVGTSLRDPSVVRLFTEAKICTRGVFVAPDMYETTKVRVRRWGLECIQADAESFFASLASSVQCRDE